ncbi:MAG TPA: adenylate/guanylate cyclase domain-containing protein [Acidimicrobiales bacterium]|nr:adenylate/guanylate cyclase domain-containing protein [Acidimicrobiales bacterium]
MAVPEDMPSDEELEALGLYSPSWPDADVHLQLLRSAFDHGATIEEVGRAVRKHFNVGPLLLDLALRPDGETMDLAAFADRHENPALVRRIWSAFGLSDAPDSMVRVTPDAAEAVGVLEVLSHTAGEDVALGLARIVGSSMERLAEAIADTFRVLDEVPKLKTGTTRAQVAEAYTEFAPAVLPMLLDAVAAVFRRQLIQVSFDTWSTDSDDTAVTRHRTVCFADLVGSTETIRSVSNKEMARLLHRFEQLVWGLVSAHGGRVVKFIGDEAMFVLPDADAACTVGLELMARSERPVRIGMAHGEVIGMLGDYFGPTVNLAARLVDLADASTIALSQTVRESCRLPLTFTPDGAQMLKGFAEPVQVFRLTGTP